MERDDPFESVLCVFAHYGFRKSSMEDLARATDLSRQTLYNRFKTKQAVLDWAVEGFIGKAREQASAALKDDASPATCLLNAFSRWMGDHVAILHDAPHGAETMEMGIESLKRSDTDPHADFEKDVIRFLKDRGICKTRKQAADKAFLLLVSSKGLLLKSRSGEEFRSGMARIIGAAT